MSEDGNGRVLASEKPKFERLPTHTVPQSYNIILKPDLKAFSFTGSVSINVEVKNATKELVLDAVELEVSDAEFTGSDGVTKKPSIKLSPETERVVFSFDDTLPLGAGTIKCNFKGTLNENLKGFYRSKTKDVNGDDTYFAVTQFEATDAHRAFPCWDEPAIKATFNVTLVVKKDLLALSNMDVASEADDPSDSSLKVVHFNPTPKMSTYLVAAVVGKYDVVESASKRGVKVRVYTPIGKKDQGVFALDVAVKALDFYEDYFKIDYPLPKADFVAIADFAAGAMENWGLVTCREAALLFDPANTSASRKQRIAVVVTHELAHMWFGNLVTMEWWTNLWLNEGFASFMEHLATDHIFPEYDMFTQFVSDTQSSAFSLDSLDSSHPIEVPIHAPEEIDEIFDDISYQKGASVIRMLYRYIGDESFRKGMQLYLERFKYQNTVTEDLWKALAEASNSPVESVMNSWVKQMGYPIINVSSTHTGDNILLKFKQEKFYASVDNPNRSKAQPQWKVPIIVSTSADPNATSEQFLLEGESGEHEIKNAPNVTWVKINAGAVGVYRTLYSDEMLDTFTDGIRSGSIPALDRLSIYSDMYALVQSGYKNADKLLELTLAYENETDFAVWSSISGFLGQLSVLVSDDEKLQQSLFQYGRHVYRNIFATLGWDSKKEDGHTTSLLRSMVLNSLVTFGDEQVLAEAKSRFDNYVSGKQIIHADLRTPIYRGVAKKMDAKTWDTFMTLYKNADLQEEANRIGTSLGAVQSSEYIMKVLEFADSPQVRNQDFVFVLTSVASSAIGRQITWDFFRKNYEKLKQKTSSGFLTSKLIKGCTEDFSTFEMAKEVETFFAEHPFAGAERTVRQAIETVELNAKWRQRDTERIKNFLDKFVKSS